MARGWCCKELDNKCFALFKNYFISLWRLINIVTNNLDQQKTISKQLENNRTTRQWMCPPRSSFSVWLMSPKTRLILRSTQLKLVWHSSWIAFYLTELVLNSAYTDFFQTNIRFAAKQRAVRHQSRQKESHYTPERRVTLKFQNRSLLAICSETNEWKGELCKK